MIIKVQAMYADAAKYFENGVLTVFKKPSIQVELAVVKFTFSADTVITNETQIKGKALEAIFTTPLKEFDKMRKNRSNKLLCPTPDYINGSVVKITVDFDRIAKIEEVIRGIMVYFK